MNTDAENHQSSADALPYVTVIVPVFNMPQLVQLCIEGLLSQTYPKHRYEVLVVDNGSTDNTRQIIQQYPVKLLLETGIRSPYAARNLGLKHAQGEIIAMIDATCTPIPAWLHSGVRTLESGNADLVGGKITFTFSSAKTTAEIYDSISNVKMKSSIETRGVAKGGNLFVRKHIFDAIGLFPASLRSGGDVLWTGRATRAGFKLVYSPDAEALYPARKLFPLLKKQIRVGRGQPPIWLDQGLTPARVILRVLLGFRPPTPAMVRNAIREQGTPDMEHRLVAVWLVAWLCNITTNLGRIRYILSWLFPARTPVRK